MFPVSGTEKDLASLHHACLIPRPLYREHLTHFDWAVMLSGIYCFFLIISSSLNAAWQDIVFSSGLCAHAEFFRQKILLRISWLLCNKPPSARLPPCLQEQHPQSYKPTTQPSIDAVAASYIIACPRCFCWKTRRCV